MQICNFLLNILIKFCSKIVKSILKIVIFSNFIFNIYFMKKLYVISILFLSYSISFSQDGFHFLSKKDKISIPFQLANNLIIVPVKLNNVSLNFLLDTGVEKTVLFALEGKDSLRFENIQKIKLRGLGTGEPIEGLFSKNNRLIINKLEDKSHEVYIILDQDVNFSTQLGITINGIIGYNFFKDFFIEINYQKKKLVIYKNKEAFSARKLKRFDEIPLSIELEKPYITIKSTIASQQIDTKMLIDTGGSDALWLFEDGDKIKIPEKNFQDFLGRGFSGDIYGKRSRIEQIIIGKHKIDRPTVSFPDTLSLKSLLVDGRNGTIGGEVLRRFNVIFDYANKKIYLKKSSIFSEPFNYNMSGLEIQHNGLQWIQEEIPFTTNLVFQSAKKEDTETTSLKYRFTLKPVFEISHVRSNSPAAIAGILKDDRIVKINGNNAYRYKIEEINQLMQSEDGKLILLEIDRKGRRMKFKFNLKKIL
jgi:hypothetical protein